MQKNKRIMAILGMISGIGIAFAYINPYEGKIELTELILQLSGSRGNIPLGFSITELMNFILCMLPNYIAILILGNRLYSHFCIAGIYIFSRCPIRRKWYRKELLALFADICIYQIFFLSTAIAVTILRYQILVNEPGLKVLGVHFLIYTLWIFSWSLMVNLCATKTGSSMAFVTIITFHAGCVALLGMINTMQIKHAAPELIKKIVWINPISHTVLGWQDKISALADARDFPYSMGLAETIGILLIFLSGMVIIGEIVTQRQEFLTENREEGTI